MSGDPEYRPFQYRIADLLALMGIVALLGATTACPYRNYTSSRCSWSCTW